MKHYFEIELLPGEYFNSLNDVFEYLKGRYYDNATYTNVTVSRDGAEFNIRYTEQGEDYNDTIEAIEIDNWSTETQCLETDHNRSR